MGRRALCGHVIYYRRLHRPGNGRRRGRRRVLVVHLMRIAWRGPASELDWHKETEWALLAEVSGMSAEELAAI